jgi:hypothetical protein
MPKLSYNTFSTGNRKREGNGLSSNMVGRAGRRTGQTQAGMNGQDVQVSNAESIIDTREKSDTRWTRSSRNYVPPRVCARSITTSIMQLGKTN